MVMEVVHEEMGDGSMHCSNHPFKNSAVPGGICAFCLQEKLGNLVSSSFPVAIFPSSSSSPSPSFRSDFGGSSSTASGTDATAVAGGGGSSIQIRSMAASLSADNQTGGNACSNRGFYSGRSMLSFLLTHEKKKSKDAATRSADSAGIVFKRSKSIATPRRGLPFFNEHFTEDYCSNRKGLWSFLYLSKHSKRDQDLNFPSAAPISVEPSNANAVVRSGVIQSRAKRSQDFAVVDENGSPDRAVLDRKVSRSRSVGCGSRSFSGDFFERISTGFGDCTLRRVESQREGKPKVQPMHRSNGQDCIKERVKCGGIFGGFMITSSSTGEDGENGRSIFATPTSSVGQHPCHGRSRSWAWALASPMRAFGKPGKRDAGSGKNPTPNLDATPSLVAVRT